MSTLTPSIDDHISTISVKDNEPSKSTLWPFFGILAGASGIASIFLQASVSEKAKAAGVDAVFAELGTGRAKVQIAASLGFLTIALLVAFGAGLHRHLKSRLPSNSNIPTAIGLLLGGAVGTMSVVYSLKAMLAGGMPGGVDTNLYTKTDVTVLHLLVDQLQWATWVPVAMMLPVIGFSAFKYRAVSRWLGTVSIIFGLFFVFMTSAFALPYSSGIVGGPWLVIAGLGLIRAARRTA